MTRLSEALNRAAAETATESVRSAEASEGREGGPTTWQFAPVETMHVPVERSAVAAEGREGGPQVRSASAPATTPELRRIESGAIRVGEADRSRLVIDGAVNPNVVEQYRHLAAVLHHAQEASGVCTVMVTSAMASEGKTLTATNLALTLSQSYQRRVLLIDADLRRPRLREMFALPPTEGLTDSLATHRGGKLPVRQISPTLWVLTAGRAVPDPMSLLVSPAMKQLIDDARDSFDWIVIDTPPIAILPDANLLSQMIDTALLVVSAESTPYPMVQRAVDAIGRNRILGVVLNRADMSGLSPYDYYGYSGYQQAPKPQPQRWFKWFGKPPADSALEQHHVQ